MIRVANLSHRYVVDSPLVLDNISFDVPEGTTLSVVGPSGCGKTTLLYVLGGLIPVASGKVLVRGQEVNTARRQSSLIFQDFGLLPWKTAWQNVCVGMSIGGIPGSMQRQTAGALFRDLSISGKENSYPIQLSGGEKQRVAIARSLATNPDLLLMDEPFSALDAMTREKLQDVILDEWRSRKLTMILVTHSIEEAVFLGGRIMILSNRPARIEGIIDNPGFGTEDYRLKNEYFDVITRVRSVIKGSENKTLESSKNPG